MGRVILRRWRLWAAAAVVVIALGLGIWLLWPSPPPPRARPYLDWTACLLTDGQGIGGPQGSVVWAGMQDASLATHARVQYVPVAGGTSTGDALPYLASLLQRQCAVVVAVGEAQVTAVATDAARYPAVRFVVVGGSATAGNVTVLNGLSGPQLRDRIRALVVDAVHAATPR